MNSERWKRVRALFEEATDRRPADRDAWLARECADDEGLKSAVERMLAVETPPEFLISPTGAAPFHEASPAPTVEPGRRIGNYEILQPVASGGMGTVYEALQIDPRRRVALKVMRLGLGTPSAVRRFRYESELLARLVHPGIAQVHEAGVHSEDGMETPFFAMELVERARDILSFARENHLDLRARLELFLPICRAVHFGHLRGVIHRDLKPANLLVDATGRTKVIDFGVARLVESDADAMTLATKTGELVGTLWYISPEQLSGDPAAVDARADVYALGVVLYELLCGRMPYDLRGLSLAAVAERVTQIAPDPIEPDVPDELGWVLLRALEKEPERRYASASELEQDLRRFLDHEPVLAGPPSAIYRLRKFARRNRVWVAATAVAVLALVSGTVAALVGMERARRQTVRAEDESLKFQEINDVLVETMSAIHPGRDGRDVRAYELLDRAAERVASRLGERAEVRAGLELALAESYMSLGLRPEAEALARRAISSLRTNATGDPEQLAAQNLLARCLVLMGREDEALELLAEALPIAMESHGSESAVVLSLLRIEARAHRAIDPPEQVEERVAALAERAIASLGPDHGVTLEILTLHVINLRDMSRWVDAQRVNDDLIAAHMRRSGPDAFETLDRRLVDAVILSARGRMGAALALYEELLPIWLELVGDEHPLALGPLHGYATALREVGRHAEAEAVWTPMIPVMERVLGPENPTTANARSGLAISRAKLGGARQGEGTLRELLTSARSVRGDEHRVTIQHEVNLGTFLADTAVFDQDKRDESRRLLNHALEVRRRDLPPDHERILDVLDALGLLHYNGSDFAAAAPLFREAWDGYRRAFDDHHPKAMTAMSNLATTLARMKRYGEALPVALESLRVNLEARAEDDPRLVIMTANIGALHNLRGSTKQAEEWYARALARAERYLPADHPLIPTWRRAQAEVLMKQTRFLEAEEILSEVVAVSELGAPLDHSSNLIEHARCLAALDRTEEALRALELAYEIRIEHAGEHHNATREVAGELARVCAQAERDEEAKIWLELAGDGPQ